MPTETPASNEVAKRPSIHIGNTTKVLYLVGQLLIYLVDGSELGVAHDVERILILAHDELVILVDAEPFSANSDAQGLHQTHVPAVMRYLIEELLSIGVLVLHRSYWPRYRVV